MVSPNPDVLCGRLAGRSRGQHHLGALLADHDRGRVGVAAGHVGMIEASATRRPCDAVHPQSRIDHGSRSRAHPAGADRVQVDTRGADPLEQLVVALQRARRARSPRRRLASAATRDRSAIPCGITRHDAGTSYSLDRKLKRISGGASGSARFEPHRAAALRAQMHRAHGEARERLRHDAVARPSIHALQANMLICRSGARAAGRCGPRRRTEQPVAGQRAGAERARIASPAAGEPRQPIARSFSVTGCGAAIADIGVEVVVQVGADAGHVPHHRDAERRSRCAAGPSPDSSSSCGEPIDAARDDHLARRRARDAGRAACGTRRRRRGRPRSARACVRAGDDGEVLALPASPR